MRHRSSLWERVAGIFRTKCPEGLFGKRCLAPSSVTCLRYLGAGLVCLGIMSGLFAEFSGTILPGPRSAMAQDGEVIEEDLGPLPSSAEEDSEDASVQETPVLVWMYESLRLFYSIVFLSLSFTLVALIVMNLLTVRRDNIAPLRLIQGFESHLNEKQYQEAYELAHADESFLGRVLSAGLAKVSAGYDQAIEAMQEVGEDENMKLEHRLSYLSLIGTISPMIGLLGTVHGMINAFTEINRSGAAVQAQQLAGGISKALLTTLIGLMIAIPAIAVFNILRNRVQRLVLEVGILSEGLMSRFSNVGPATASSAAKPAAAKPNGGKPSPAKPGPGKPSPEQPSPGNPSPGNPDAGKGQ